MMPYSADTPPLVLAPASEAGVRDRRGRFREIFCAVLESHGHVLPDYRSCEAALTRVGSEPAGTGQPVDLGPSKLRLIAAEVPGFGDACFKSWLRGPGTVTEYLRRGGYDSVQLKVDALSSSENNARQIRDAIMAMPLPPGAPRLVLVGFSKGAADALEAVVAYPEIRSRVVAVVSAAGAVAGSPLANDAEQYHADLLRYFPGSTCDVGDRGAIASLRPATRLAWLARNPLPRELHYYSLVAFPQPESISRILRPSYNKLARIDARNDSLLIFYDQVVPGSILMGYLNADHWAVVAPIDRKYRFVTSHWANENAYPREALLEAVLRFVEEDLVAADKGGDLSE
jgi:dienelactone hydrolase